MSLVQVHLFQCSVTPDMWCLHLLTTEEKYWMGTSAQRLVQYKLHQRQLSRQFLLTLNLDRALIPFVQEAKFNKSNSQRQIFNNNYPHCAISENLHLTSKENQVSNKNLLEVA